MARVAWFCRGANLSTLRTPCHPVLIPFSRQMYIRSHKNSDFETDEDMRVQKIGFYLGHSPQHRLEVTAIRTSTPDTSSQSPHVHVSVASQIGCQYNCAYCASSRLGGLRRNLELEEMLSQLLYFQHPFAFSTDEELSNPSALLDATNRDVSKHPERIPISSISIHGHGEPLDNPMVFDFLAFLQDSGPSIGISPGPIQTSLCTVGILPSLKRLLDEFSSTAVTWTLNTPFPKQRLQLMPRVEHEFPLLDVIKLLSAHRRRHSHRRLSIGYLLLKDTNDSERHLHALIDLVQPHDLPIALIEYHPVLVPSANSHTVRKKSLNSPFDTFMNREKDPTWFEPSSKRTLHRWHSELLRHGIPVTIQQYFEFPTID